MYFFEMAWDGDLCMCGRRHGDTGAVRRGSHLCVMCCSGLEELIIVKLGARGNLLFELLRELGLRCR
jgi:hypothetical protein